MIGQAGGIVIEDLRDAMDVIAALLESPSTVLVIRRPSGTGCETVVYELDVP